MKEIKEKCPECGVEIRQIKPKYLGPVEVNANREDDIHDKEACLRNQINQSTEKEAERWAYRFDWIRGDNFYWIDGSGVDSGDILDVVDSEIHQRINYYSDTLYDAGLLDEFGDKHGSVEALCNALKSERTKNDLLDLFPKTVDGVTIVPDMNVWHLETRNAGKSWRVVHYKIPSINWPNIFPFPGYISDRCYSTEQAAEKAAEDANRNL